MLKTAYRPIRKFTIWNLPCDNIALYNGSRKFIFKNGFVEEDYYIKELKTQNGIITVKSRFRYLESGDLVFLNGQTADDGKYHLTDQPDISYLQVVDGRITTIKTKYQFQSALIVVALLAAAICLYIIYFSNIL